MDERFDALARRLGAASRSRRAALTLLTGGSLSTLLGSVVPSDAAKRRRGKRGKAAQHASRSDPRVYGLACRMAQPKGLVKGEKCGKKMEVAKHHPPHGCCPGSSCMRRIPLIPVDGNKKGWCYCNDGTEPDPEHQGFCRKPPPPACVEVTEPCHSSDACCQNTPKVCAPVDNQKGTERCAFGLPVCCHPEGVECDFHCDCCGSLRCGPRAGAPPGSTPVCQPPPDVCHGLAESCADGEPCCPGAGSCRNGQCCLPDAVACPGRCGPDEDCLSCCAGYCRADRRCGPPQGCVEYAGVCTTTEECCNNVDCTSGSDGVGRCRYP